MAVADSPEGPWRKVAQPLIEPSSDGEWLGEEDNRFLVKKKGGFDSHKTHDPCLMFYKNQFYLDYKGERMGEQMDSGGREINWGVAIANKIVGPYVKSPYNPVTNSGHEVMIWHYRGGIAALLTTDGPEKNTMQYAADGINFEIMASIKNPPEAGGLFRTPDNDKGPLEGLRWGLCHQFGQGRWGYIRRYEVDESQKNRYISEMATFRFAADWRGPCRGEPRASGTRPQRMEVADGRRPPRPQASGRIRQVPRRPDGSGLSVDGR